MSLPILTRQQLSSYMDRCKTSLNDCDVAPLAEFATLIQTLANVVNDQVFFSIPQIIGTYSNEITKIKMLVAFPILAESDRGRCNSCLKEAIEEGTRGLEMLKTEICGNSTRNPDNILKAMAIFSKHGYSMYTLRNQFTAMPPNQGSDGE